MQEQKEAYKQTKPTPRRAVRVDCMICGVIDVIPF